MFRQRGGRVDQEMREVQPWRLGWNVNVVVAWGTIINPVGNGWEMVGKWLGNGWEPGCTVYVLHCILHIYIYMYVCMYVYISYIYISFDLIISCIPGARHDRSKDPLTCDPWDSSRIPPSACRQSGLNLRSRSLSAQSILCQIDVVTS